MMLHTLGFLWIFGGSRGGVGFLVMFFLLLFVLRIARGAYRSRWRGGYGPRYNKYYRPQDQNQGQNQGQNPSQGQGQPTQNPYYGAPGNYSEGSGTGAETVRTDSGAETHRVDSTEGAMPRVYGEPTRPLERQARNTGQSRQDGGQVYDGERDDTTADQS